MYFTNSQYRTVHNLNIFIDNKPITEKQSTKFLGVVLDSHLTWNDHFKKISTSVSKAIGILIMETKTYSYKKNSFHVV